MQNIKLLKIGKRFVGPGHPTYIIFEVASTHANDWNLAKNYVKQAKQAGADAIKFQLFRADKLLNPISSLLLSTYEYFKTAETPRDWFPKLKKLCHSEGIDLLCTPFDEDSANFLNKIGLPAVKIASGDLTNYSLLCQVAKFGKPIILSTGMATMDEVEKSVKFLKDSGCKRYAILQCTSVYPMPYEDANLKVIQTFIKKFKTVIGYSDNGSKGDLVTTVAVSLGASIIEKHVTSQKQRGNMDDVFSLSVEEFKTMTQKIRLIEKKYKKNLLKAEKQLRQEHGSDIDKILGSAEKKPARHGYIRENGTRFIETDERHWARRGVYLKQAIKKGAKISKDMLILLRPDVGVSSINYDNIVGSRASENLNARQPLFFSGNQVRMFRKSDIHPTYDKEDKEFAKILSKTALFK